MTRSAVLSLYLPIVAILAFDGALLASLAWAYHSPRFARYRISPMPSMKVGARERLVNIAWSSVLSLALVFGLTWLIRGAFHDRPTSLARIGFEILLILLVYDFAYYWLHRLMHVKRFLPLVHGIHHKVLNPTAMESFYLHPLELTAGLALLMLCTFACGPVHVWSFSAVFFLHSTLNIVVHCGLLSGHWLLSPIDHLTRKHHLHHMENAAKNYASLTPLPDMLFGTYR
jgi:sterol desaturase/sphingolipid hydroxylase (fatty acid hydroxylase superfamily)